MPVKIARSAPRPSFGLPELLVAIHTSRQSCYKAGKSANIHASSGVIRGIPVKSLSAAISSRFVVYACQVLALFKQGGGGAELG